MLCMIMYLLQTVAPGNTFSAKFRSLLSKYPNVDVGAMGFVKNWDQDPFWN
jgi:hypothetical protein